MDSNIIKKNIRGTIVLQVATIIYGFVTPRIVLLYFGSDLYGMSASITQFLSYVQLLEGGVSGVIMAALYKPLVEHNNRKISDVVNTSRHFFKQIGIVYAIYSIIVALIYPLQSKVDYSFKFVFCLVIVLSCGTLIQYLFSLSYKILLQADQKGYIVSYATTTFFLVSLVLTLIIVKFFSNFILLKFVNSVTFVIQPLIFGFFVRKYYKIDNKKEFSKDVLSNRWDGFGQNLAYFIHSNTDVIVLTVFSTFADVAIYSVYYMVVQALMGLINSVSNAISPSVGNAFVDSNIEEKNRIFSRYEFFVSYIATFCFTCCSVLIVPFVIIYTKGINDANYDQSVFAIMLVSAEFIYCLRSPYVNIAYNAGHFKQTSKYAYLEAFINIVMSIVLVPRFGLVGVAVGTIVSMAIRCFQHALYLRHTILCRSVILWLKRMLICGVVFLSSNIVIRYCIPIHVNSVLSWLLFAVVTAIISFAILNIALFIFDRKELMQLIKRE